MELHGPLFQHRNAADGFARKRPRISLPQPALDAWLPVGGSHFDHVVVECLDHGKGGIEQAPQAFGDGVEHRLGVVHRAADGGKDFRGGGLLLERFLQVAGARLDLFEQPDVRNRDDGLVGEHLDRLDLTLRERLKVRLAQHDRADDLTFVQKRRHQKRARTAKAYPALAQLRNFIHQRWRNGACAFLGITANTTNRAHRWAWDWCGGHRDVSVLSPRWPQNKACRRAAVKSLTPPSHTARATFRQWRPAPAAACPANG